MIRLEDDDPTVWESDSPTPATPQEAETARELKMVQSWNAFWSDEGGQGLTEYALIIGLVSVALVLVLVAMSDSLGVVFNAIVDELQNAGPAINQQPVT